jgi:hypothetical protein
MAWQPPDRLVIAPAPAGNSFRLGELVVPWHAPHPPVPTRVTGEVLASGYLALPQSDGWLHFRPRTTWWRNGLVRHARLRDQNLHVRILDEADGGGWIVHAIGLLTAPLERRLARQATLYEPA